MKFNNFIDCGVLIFIGFQALVQSVAAGTVTFTIDPTRSSITLSGSLGAAQLGTYPLTAQGSGSLTTTYAGSILADLTPPNIQFPGGSLIMANTNGTWQPAVGGGTGSAPADYGAEVKQTDIITAYFAERNLQFDVTSSMINLTNGDFPAELLVIHYVTNNTPAPARDYNITIPLEPSHDTNGSESLTGSTTNNPDTAYLTNSDCNLALFVPINITHVSMKSGYTNMTNLKGTVVATAPASAWPLSLSVGLQAGQVSLTWASFPGPTFTVQTTADLGIPWSTATGVATVQTNTTTWTGAATNAVQYYRLQAAF